MIMVWLCMIHTIMFYKLLYLHIIRQYMEIHRIYKHVLVTSIYVWRRLTKHLTRWFVMIYGIFVSWSQYLLTWGIGAKFQQTKPDPLFASHSSSLFVPCLTCCLQRSGRTRTDARNGERVAETRSERSLQDDWTTRKYLLLKYRIPPTGGSLKS